MKRTPSISQARSLTRYGTPAKGPAKGPAGAARACSAASSAARSKTGVTTAFSTGFSASIRSMAATTSSAALTWPVRTSSAWAVASSSASSSFTPHSDLEDGPFAP